jgi:hypothetical protein
MMKTKYLKSIALVLIACTLLACTIWDRIWVNETGPQAPMDIIGTMVPPVGGYPQPGQDEGTGDLSIDECLASPQAFSWAYESIEIDADGANIICNADFKLTNFGQESLAAIVRTAWDNTVQQSQSWQVHPLALGETLTEHANETHLAQDSYMRVTHLLIVRDIPECRWATSPSQKAMWESIASPIQSLACP